MILPGPHTIPPSVTDVSNISGLLDRRAQVPEGLVHSLNLSQSLLSLGTIENWKLTKCLFVFEVGRAKYGNLFFTLEEISRPCPRTEEAITKVEGPQTSMKFISYSSDTCYFLLVRSNQCAIIGIRDQDDILWNGEPIKIFSDWVMIEGCRVDESLR